MAQEPDGINLTNQELQILSELDSRQFGFLKLSSPEQTKKKELVLKAVKYLEQMLVQAQKQKECAKHFEKNEASADKEINIDPKTYCKLGHFHLLLEDYAKAMSAYQKFFGLKADYWKDASFLYGQGLVYFHFNAFQCLLWLNIEDHYQKLKHHMVSRTYAITASPPPPPPRPPPPTTTTPTTTTTTPPPPPPTPPPPPPLSGSMIVDGC
ncbi:Uncharacterized protein GBIM_20244 [Gryllus bimaculatus]|nr:Uncharacterized protein GBIM_20244 [Gryllus bimaculatus]